MPSALLTKIDSSSAATASGLYQDVPLSYGKTPVDISDDAALLWLFAVAPIERNLSPPVRQAITTANVVIYDRALAAIGAAALPLGGYAEPAASSSAPPDQTIERCLRFVLDGWSVVRLADQDEAAGRRARDFRNLAERLAASNVPDDLPVLLFTNADDGRYRRIETQLGALDAELNAASTSGLAIIFGTIAMAAGRRVRAVMSKWVGGLTRAEPASDAALTRVVRTAEDQCRGSGCLADNPLGRDDRMAPFFLGAPISGASIRT